MLALFADLPEATRNSVEIARRCAFRPRTRKPILPRFTASDGARASTRPRETAPPGGGGAGGAARARMAWRRAFAEDDYRERLAFELDVIVKMKFPGYFLIVSDFIKWAKAHGIPVGPGRGSGAGSLVA